MAKVFIAFLLIFKMLFLEIIKTIKKLYYKTKWTTSKLYECKKIVYILNKIISEIA